MDIFKEAFDEVYSRRAREIARGKVKNKSMESYRMVILNFSYKHYRERQNILKLLEQLEYYDQNGHNIMFTQDEQNSINNLIESDDTYNLELAKQIILERLNNN